MLLVLNKVLFKKKIFTKDYIEGFDVSYAWKAPEIVLSHEPFQVNYPNSFKLRWNAGSRNCTRSFSDTSEAMIAVLKKG